MSTKFDVWKVLEWAGPKVAGGIGSMAFDALVATFFPTPVVASQTWVKTYVREEIRARSNQNVVAGVRAKMQGRVPSSTLLSRITAWCLFAERLPESPLRTAA
jgi:hypothetical protein